MLAIEDSPKKFQTPPAGTCGGDPGIAANEQSEFDSPPVKRSVLSFFAETWDPFSAPIQAKDMSDADILAEAMREQHLPAGGHAICNRAKPKKTANNNGNGKGKDKGKKKCQGAGKKTKKGQGKGTAISQQRGPGNFKPRVYALTPTDVIPDALPDTDIADTRKRVTSRYYHREFTRCKKLGMTKARSKAHARHVLSIVSQMYSDAQDFDILCDTMVQLYDVVSEAITYIYIYRCVYINMCIYT